MISHNVTLYCCHFFKIITPPFEKEIIQTKMALGVRLLIRVLGEYCITIKMNLMLPSTDSPDYDLFLHTACCFGYHHGISLVYWTRRTVYYSPVDTHVGVAYNFHRCFG